MSGDPGTPQEKLAALNERLKGTSLLALLNIKNKPAPDALLQRVVDLREVVFALAQHLPANDPVRATALERLKSVEALVQDPLEWHILTRAQELRQDPSDPQVRAMIEAAFYEEHVPRAVWQSAPPDGVQAEVRKSMRLPVLIDVELDIGGKRTKLQTQNLSRDGACLEVPAGFNARDLKMVLHLPPQGQQITVDGAVVWREAGRVGVSLKMGVPEQNALDAALQNHFASLTRTVDRWREVAPKSGSAIACAAMVGYASSALPSTRREYLEKLAAAAQSDFGSKELQLALAKLRIEERDLDGAQTALKRVVVADRADPRYRLLELTLQQRLGTRGMTVGARARHMLVAAKGPAIAASVLALVVAGGFAWLSLRGPYEAVPVPIGGLPCDSMKLVPPSALCFIDPARYEQIPGGDREKLARKTVDLLSGHEVMQLTVVATTREDVLDAFFTDAAAAVSMNAR